MFENRFRCVEPTSNANRLQTQVRSILCDNSEDILKQPIKSIYISSPETLESRMDAAMLLAKFFVVFTFLFIFSRRSRELA